MKIGRIVLTIMVYGINSLVMNAQTYESMWKQVDEAMEKDLPREAIKHTEPIYAKAVKEKNFPQMMKAWVSLVSTKSTIDADSFRLADIAPADYSTPAEKAIYHAIMGSAYLSMRTFNNINRNEDSLAYYEKKGKEHLALSLKDKKELAREKASDYLPLFTLNDDSRLYGHDLLSVLTGFAAERSTLEESLKYYEEAREFYKQENNREAYTLMALQCLDRQETSNEERKKALKALLEESKDLESEADVALSYAYVLESEGSVSSQEDKEAIADQLIEFVRNAQIKYKHSKLKNAFKEIENSLLSGMIAFKTVGEKVVANSPFEFKLSYTNMAGVKLSVRKYNGLDGEGRLNVDGKLILERNYLFTTDEKTRSRMEQNLPYDGEFSDKMTLPADHYVIVMESGTVTNAYDFYLSSIRLVDLSLPGHQHIFTVVDALTGRPVKGATVHLHTYSNQDNNEIELKCDENGECRFTISNNKRYQAWATLQPNDCTAKVPLSSYSQLEKPAKTTRMEIFTDRAVYRPGQTTHVGVIAYRSDGDVSYILPFADLTLTLRDANNQIVETKSIKTNDWGTADSDFLIPKNRLPGRFTVTAETDGASIMKPIRVEEYKRPTFEVSAESTDEEREITFGDSIHVTFNAKSLTGIPVQNANVKYKLSKAFTRFRSWYSAYWEEVETGEMITDDQGQAKVVFRVDDNKQNVNLDQVIRYQLMAEVTDVAGETHSCEFYTAVSRQGFNLVFQSFNSIIDVSKPVKPEPTVKAYNANHKELIVNGTYTVSIKDEILYNGEFVTNRPIVIPSLPMGTYTFKFTANDSHGNIITESCNLTLYNTSEAIAPGSKKNQAQTEFNSDFGEVDPSYATISEEKPAVFYFSPREDDAYVSYTIIANGQVIERKYLTLDKKLYKFSINYRQEYGDGLKVIIGYVRNGHSCDWVNVFHYQKPDTHLYFTWKTFRDKLTPGQEETWILTLKDKNGQVVNAAEMMATMYDTSIDQFAPNYWNFYVNRTMGIVGGSLDFSIGSLQNHRFIIRKKVLLPVSENRVFDALTSYFSPSNMGRRVMMRLRGNNRLVAPEITLKSLAVDNIVMEEYDELEMTNVDQALQGRIAGLDIVMNSGNLGAGSTMRLSGVSSSSDKENLMENEWRNENKIEMRSNFAETAFFYPHLVTDENGDVHISFTLPESLTTWKFMGFAHTKDVRYGNLDTLVVAKKDFMIQPNMPRFVREGDKVSISSRIVNQSEQTQASHVKFVVKDAETDMVIWTDQKQINVEAGKTAQVLFNFDVNGNYPLLICEITAENNSFSDGERNYLPVLSSKKYVTESTPFYVYRGESKEVNLNDLFNENSSTATQKRMLLEFTANPLWTIIEALEGVKLPELDNAPCFAASLYANTLARKFAGQIPGLEETLRQQTMESDSQLSNDEDVKDIILKESPWLRDALKEKNHRADLIDFFDKQLMSQRINTAKQRLKHLQNNDGSWSWFDGMKGSYYITESVVEDLIYLASDDDEVKTMLTKGLTYLDKENLSDYNKMKQKKIKPYPSERILRYLYLSAIMPDRKINKELQKMREDYLHELEKQSRTFSIYGKANGAYILRAFGHTKKADDFLRSAIQYSVSKPGMGRYYATDKAQYSWRDYKIPTHLAVMNAIRQSVLKDRVILLADMQVWLLRQKQSQMWDNPMNTISAVQYLVNTDKTQESSAISTMRTLPVFTLDGNQLSAPLDTTKFLAEQLGYIKTPVENSLITNGIHRLKVQSTESLTGNESIDRGPSSISWGAVYTQFNEELRNLKNHSSGELRISRRIMVDGKDLDRTLKVGDKVTVRLTIEADRDMDFVQIHSQHPACFEPTNQLSGYHYLGGLGGYVAHHDASTDVFFDHFAKGSVSYDLEFYVTRAGEYLAGIATVQCAYAPEFIAHTLGIKVKVSE